MSRIEIRSLGRKNNRIDTNNNGRNTNHAGSDCNHVVFNNNRVDVVIVSLAQATGAYIAQQPDSHHSDLNFRF